MGRVKNDFKEDSTFDTTSETTDKYDKLWCFDVHFPTHFNPYVHYLLTFTHFGPHPLSGAQCYRCQVDVLDEWITKDALESAKVPKP
jgi:hypothetical protein